MSMKPNGFVLEWTPSVSDDVVKNVLKRFEKDHCKEKRLQFFQKINLI
jgi:hypothetical protein